MLSKMANGNARCSRNVTYFMNKVPLPDDNFVHDSDLLFYYEDPRINNGFIIGILYPFNLIFRWLSYKNDPSSEQSFLNDPNFFMRREISFSCLTRNDEEMYIRWQSFKTVKQLRDKIINMKPLPHKFDIGAVYNIPICERDSTTTIFRPEQKELVFDIDLNDYDDIRTCCKEKKICKRCWKFLHVAIRLIDTSLREDFGCTRVLWVYSGRRGIHCWVSDAMVRVLPGDGRVAIADYLNLVTGGDQRSKKVTLKGKDKHPFVERSFDISMNHMAELLEEQNFFNSSSPHIHSVLNYLSENDSQRKMKDEVNSKQKMEEWIQRKRVFNSLEFFNKLCDIGQLKHSDNSKFYIENFKSLDSEERRACFLHCKVWLKEIVFAYSYPRLDINVSKDMGHLLKAPFCVHIKTGRISVPIDINNLDDFNPTCVPTVCQLRQEYDASSDSLEIEDRTSLGFYTYYFRSKFLDGSIKHISEVNKELLGEFAIINPEW